MARTRQVAAEIQPGEGGQLNMQADIPRVQRSQSLAEASYTALRDSILSGALRPQARIREGDMCLLLGVSRTPVREALRRLEFEGFLTRQDGALRVSAASVDSIWALFDVRIPLEGYATRLAADFTDPASVEAMREADRRCLDSLESRDYEGLARANEDLHDRICNLANSPRLSDLVKHYRRAALDHFLGRKLYEYGPQEILRSGFHEHANIIDALEAHDGVLAEDLMRAHVGVARDLLIKAIAEETSSPIFSRLNLADYDVPIQ